MRNRKLEQIYSTLQYYSKSRYEKEDEFYRLKMRARTYIELADYEEDKKIHHYTKALNCFNKSIALDGNDYDPMPVAERVRLLIKIIQAHLDKHIVIAGQRFDVDKQLKIDEQLLNDGLEKVKHDHLNSQIIKNTLKALENLKFPVTAQKEPPNQSTGSIFSGLRATPQASSSPESENVMTVVTQVLKLNTDLVGKIKQLEMSVEVHRLEIEALKEELNKLRNEAPTTTPRIGHS